MEGHVKWIITSILVLGIGGYFIYSATKPLDTELLEVKVQTVAQTFKEEGMVKAANERPVYSITGGKISEIVVEEGQSVKKGDLLVEIETKELEYQLGQLKGQLESIKGQEKQANNHPYEAQLKQQQFVIEETKRQHIVAKEDYQRLKQLYENGAVSKSELDDAKRQMEQLENSLKQEEQALKVIAEQIKPVPGTDQYFNGLRQSMQEQIDHLQYLLSNSKITASINGIVNELPVTEGEIVTTQTPLMRLSGDDEFEIEVYLLTEDVLSVTEGIPVTLVQKRKNGDYSFAGTVKAIAPAAEEKISALGLTEQKVKVTIEPDREESPELRPGYALDVVFTTLEQQDKIAVPKVVLFPSANGEGDALWVVKNGKAMMQEVVTGLETDELVVIEKGLETGDLVIKNPQIEGIKEGKRMK